MRGEFAGKGRGSIGELRAVAADPASDADGVENLEEESHDPDEDVDGGHGRVDVGEDDSTVEVVEGLGVRTLAIVVWM